MKEIYEYKDIVLGEWIDLGESKQTNKQKKQGECFV